MRIEEARSSEIEDASSSETLNVAQARSPNPHLRLA